MKTIADWIAERQEWAQQDCDNGEKFFVEYEGFKYWFFSSRKKNAFLIEDESIIAPISRDAFIAAVLGSSEPMKLQIIESGTGDRFRELCDLGHHYGVPMRERFMGMGTDDIGCGVRWATYNREWDFPAIISRKVVLNVRKDYAYLKEELVNLLTGIHEVAISETGYGPYNMPVWVTADETDTKGKIYKGIIANVFNAKQAYRLGTKIFTIARPEIYFNELAHKNGVFFKVKNELINHPVKQGSAQRLVDAVEQYAVSQGAVKTLTITKTGWGMMVHLPQVVATCEIVHIADAFKVEDTGKCLWDGYSYAAADLAAFAHVAGINWE